MKTKKMSWILSDGSTVYGSLCALCNPGLSARLEVLAPPLSQNGAPSQGVGKPLLGCPLMAPGHVFTGLGPSLARSRIPSPLHHHTQGGALGTP